MTRANWILAGEAVGGIALLGVVYRQARMVLGWLAGLVVSVNDTDAALGGVLMSYLSATHPRRSVGPNYYGSTLANIRSRDAIYRVVYRCLGKMQSIFWVRGRPLWTGGALPIMNSLNSMEYHTFCFVRGMLDWPALVMSAIEYEREQKQAASTGAGVRRYRVEEVFGAGRTVYDRIEKGESLPEASAPGHPGDNVERTGGLELMHFAFDDIGVPQSPRALDQLSLMPSLLDVIDQVNFFLDSQEWCERTGVPWKLNFLWKGPPGTGKTALCRAIGEHKDLPIYAYDLSSLTNRELMLAWARMLNNTPCIALFEDIERVFHGDQNIVKDSTLTYDCFLRALDGVVRANGVISVITTNHPELIDPALAGETEDDKPTRPGRVDSYVTFLPLDHEGKLKLARRVLEDEQEAQKAAMAGTDETAAQFQRRCIEVARRRRFGQRRTA